MDVDQSVALQALSVAVAARVPVLLWGGPGTGKSSAVREPSDFVGLPVVTNGHVRFAPPRWALRLASDGHGILFLDEISTAPPAVQAALLRVVLERVVGDLELPADVAVVAAANPPEQASDGWDLSAPLANRFWHIDWNADATMFAQGITAGWPTPPVPALADDWEQRQSGTRGLVGAFVHARPNLLSQPPHDASAAGRAWPSPRTREMAARLLAACDEIEAIDETRVALVAGAVGTGAAANPNRRTLDRGWRVLAKAGDHAADVAAMAARILARCRPKGAKPPAEVKVFAPLLKEAGLLP